ncbi:radical SAM protein [Nonomuraea sp. NPDC050556]|uniref:radical SAM protein n=1 Tax=Nonomuraea sp. NPDC050556 TaxID=3364369 RepID=UPI00378BA389
MRRLRLADIDRLRRTPGRTALLYVTDRCPVGCAHCSVAARPDSPRITDYALFAEVLGGLVHEPSLEAVAISGGEPFAERRGLVMAVEALTAAGKDVVILSSGAWPSARWVTGVLELTSTVILSTDTFHRATVDLARFRRAVAQARAAGCHVIVQVLSEAPDIPGVEVNMITPLRAGRGRDVFGATRRYGVAELGPCALTASPTVRYDGVVTGCCNESVITGGGPRALRRTATTAEEVRAALTAFRTDPLLRAMGTVQPSDLVRLAPTADARYTDICGLCWRLHRDGDNHLITALMRSTP